MSSRYSLRPETHDVIINRDQVSYFLFSGELLEIEIKHLEFDITQVENLRLYKFMIGNLPEARLHAVRIGTMRAQLRQMKAGM
jgi:hypothetical protein